MGSLVNPCNPFSLIALIAVLAVLLCGWTCSVMFESCEGVSQSQIRSLSPGSIPSDTNSVPLIVKGSGFTPRSLIMWNGSTLDTTFVDSHHLQTTITQETFDSFGGGTSVQISVGSQGCTIGANSATRDLAISHAD